MRLRLKVETTSENMPNDGSINMYTSGCPHIQIRLVYIMGSPPAVVVKKCVPRYRSKNSKNRVAVRSGKTVTAMIMLHNDPQVNNGIFHRVIPGARILSIVIIKLMAPSVVPIPEICRLQII